MAASGHVRGHPTVWDEGAGVWRFAATGEPVPASGGEEPRCPFCGERAEPDGPDPCLGWLPNVESACCGHGQHEGWIRFAGGPTLAVRVDYPGCFDGRGRP